MVIVGPVRWDFVFWTTLLRLRLAWIKVISSKFNHTNEATATWGLFLGRRLADWIEYHETRKSEIRRSFLLLCLSFWISAPHRPSDDRYLRCEANNGTHWVSVTEVSFSPSRDFHNLPLQPQKAMKFLLLQKHSCHEILFSSRTWKGQNVFLNVRNKICLIKCWLGFWADLRI